MPKLFYWQKLPHFFPPGGIFFVTYRLAGSIPKEKIQALQAEKEAALSVLLKSNVSNLQEEKEQIINEYFKKTDYYIDTRANEPYWLKDNEVAKVVADSLHYLNETSINLWAFCIMPNHVHALFDLKSNTGDAIKILQQHKSFTAKMCNRVLKREGQFWERESYDHVIRNGEFEPIVNYILNNPVKAGFVTVWHEWGWTYINPALL